MFGSALMRGETLGKPVTSRQLEPRYPKSVRVDFRRLEDSTLKKYLHANGIEYHSAASSSELACMVARHFEVEAQALQPSEEDVILRGFSEYVMNFCGGNTLEDLKSRSSNKRLRKKTRRNDSVNSDVSDDESHSTDEVVPPPREVTGRVAAQAAAAAAAAAAQAEAADSPDEEENEQLFCVCHGRSYGEMIACDNQNCEGGEWFHVGCVDLKAGQTDLQTWYCPTCRELQQVIGPVT